MDDAIVLIKGQFNIDNPFSTFNHQNVEIDSTFPPGNATSSLVANWSSFCDAVDNALKPFNEAKRSIRTYATFFYIVNFSCVIVLNILQHVMTDLDYMSYSVAFPCIALPTAMLYVIIWCLAGSKMTRAAKHVEGICNEYSSTGTTHYKLIDEWWGNCSKVCSIKRSRMLYCSRVLMSFVLCW